jgi:hypothetical protein
MAIAFDTSETREYILVRDQKLPPEQQTKFILGVLDARLANLLKDSAVDFSPNNDGPDANADIKYKPRAHDVDVVRFGLKGWDVLFDKRSNQIPFDPKLHTKSIPVKPLGNRNGLTDIALDLLKPYIRELAKQIDGDNWFTEEEEKNSDTPSS